ncbi:MAG: hypothetical protein EZS28_010592 [Streblomastix strix]|uniref:Uncharacterized protein n=1 Tax=Streblomastix strix TaxID=222440 RepID=A0A5J4WG37_9EUKA|nr:MAG: hypothetical protein EZS28_010592 [Streblomastix strix]
MSIINGLRVNGFNQYDAYIMGPVLEVVDGRLSLIDIQIKDLIVFQNNQQRNSENMIKGLIVLKENAQLLQLERFLISNISVEQSQQNDPWSQIVMKAGKLLIKDGQFLGQTNPSSGTAIRADPQEDGTSVDVEGVIFKEISSNSSFIYRGGAVYVNMMNYEVYLSFKRCIFVGNQANYGSNVFIAYARPSQRVRRNSFIGCTAIVGSSYESDKSFCYLVGSNNFDIYIDESDLLHRSLQKQMNEGVVRFISNTNPLNIIQSNEACGSPSNPCDSFQSLSSQLASEQQSTDGSTGRAETVIFGEGQFMSPYINLSLTRSNTVNIVGCGQDETFICSQSITQNSLIEGGDGQSLIIERISLVLSPNSPSVGLINIKGQGAGLIMQEVKIKGYSSSTPQSTSLKPAYLIRVEGFTLLKDVIIEHVYLLTGSILQMNNINDLNNKKEVEWFGNEQSGIYNCIFDDITSNESSLIQLIETVSQTESLNKNSQSSSLTHSNVDSIKFTIDYTIFSKCQTSLDIDQSQQNGGLINIISKNTKIEIQNSDFENNIMKTRNLIYIGLIEGETEIKILNIKDSLFTNCKAAILGMEISQSQTQIFTSGQNSHQPQNPHHINENAIIDSLDKHGLIFIEKVNKGSNFEFNLGLIEISGIFVAGCHCAVGSAVSATGLTLKIQDSTFIQPACINNMIYMSNVHSQMNDCYFKGYEGLFVDPALLIETVSNTKQNSVELCPNDPLLYSTQEYGLIYMKEGDYGISKDVFERTEINIINVDHSNLIMEDVIIINSDSVGDQLQSVATCTGYSYIEVINISIDGRTEDDCKSSSQNNNECKLQIYSDSQCIVDVQSGWIIPEVPLPIVKEAQVVVNIDKEESKLSFTIKGQYFVDGNVSVKIVELGYIYGQQINKAQARFGLSNSHKTLFTNELNIKRGSNSDFIWPESGSTDQIHIEGSFFSIQIATFGMNEYQWFNFNNKQYGVLASNDRVTFSGKDGKLNEATILNTEFISGVDVDPETEPETPEKEPKYKFPWWAILLIVLGVLIFLGLIVGIVYCFVEYQMKQKTNETGQENMQHGSSQSIQVHVSNTTSKQPSGQFTSPYEQTDPSQTDGADKNNNKIKIKPFQYPGQTNEQQSSTSSLAMNPLANPKLKPRGINQKRKKDHKHTNKEEVQKEIASMENLEIEMIDDF